jgi:hypothetical protein
MVTVRRMSEFRSRQWGIYVNGSLVEGGFFDRMAAIVVARSEWGMV